MGKGCISRIQALAAAEMAQDKRKSGKATKDIHKAEETPQKQSLKY